MVYQPDSFMYVQPEKLNPKPEKIEIPGPMGTIVAWRFKGDGSKKTQILLFHGNAQNISTHFYSLYWLPARGYDYLIFDYPGYGGSQGAASQQSVYEASQVVVDWMKAEAPDRPLAFLGQSLGGNVASYTASQSLKKQIPLCLITVDSSFLSYRSAAKRLLSSHWATWPFQWLGSTLIVENYSAETKMPELSPTPLIFMHGNNDKIVNIENGREMYQAAKEPKEFWEIPDGEHIDGFVGKNRAVYQKKFLEALQKHCD